MRELPQGYKQIPNDYEGEVFLESQMNAFAEQELDACIKMFEELHERRKHMDNYALYFANLLRDRKLKCLI